jgi:hypothetical protein
MNELSREITSPTELSDAFKWASELIRLRLPAPVALFVGPPRRTREQNDKIWPMFRDLAKQVPWGGLPLGSLNEYDWKDLITAACKDLRVIPGLTGGVVVLGGHTSRMTVEQTGEMIEYMYAFGTEHDVIWSEESQKTIVEEHERKIKRKKHA